MKRSNRNRGKYVLWAALGCLVLIQVILSSDVGESATVPSAGTMTLKDEASTLGAITDLDCVGGSVVCSRTGTAGTLTITATTPPVNLYVKPSGGSDANNCQSTANACATVNGAIGKLPIVAEGADTTIHVASGAYAPSNYTPPGTSITTKVFVDRIYSGTRRLTIRGYVNPTVGQFSDATFSAAESGTSTGSNSNEFPVVYLYDAFSSCTSNSQTPPPAIAAGLGFKEIQEQTGAASAWTVSGGTVVCRSGGSPAPYSGTYHLEVPLSSYAAKAIPLTANVQYTFSAFGYNLNATQIRILVSTAAGDSGTTRCVDSNSTTSAWELLTCNYTPTADEIVFFNLDADGGNTAIRYFDDVTITAATGETKFIDTGKTWTTDAYKYGFLRLSGGTGYDATNDYSNWYPVYKNTATALHIVGRWRGSVPDNTTTYQIFRPADVPTIDGNGAQYCLYVSGAANITFTGLRCLKPTVSPQDTVWITGSTDIAFEHTRMTGNVQTAGLSTSRINAMVIEADGLARLNYCRQGSFCTYSYVLGEGFNTTGFLVGDSVATLTDSLLRPGGSTCTGTFGCTMIDVHDQATLGLLSLSRVESTIATSSAIMNVAYNSHAYVYTGVHLRCGTTTSTTGAIWFNAGTMEWDTPQNLVQGCGVGLAIDNTSSMYEVNAPTYSSNTTNESVSPGGHISNRTVGNDTTVLLQSDNGAITSDTDLAYDRLNNKLIGAPLIAARSITSTVTTTQGSLGTELIEGAGGDVQNGAGPSILFYSPDQGNTRELMGRIGLVWTDYSSASEDTDFFLRTRSAGAAETEKLRVTGDGLMGLGTDGYTAYASIPQAKVHLVATSEALSTLFDRISANTTGSQLILRKARGTIGSLADITQNDVLGGVYAGSYVSASTAYANTGSAYFIVDGAVTAAATDRPTSFVIETTPDGSTTRTERFRINFDGHPETKGTAPTLSACGTSPTGVGNDASGKVTVGSGTVTSCTVTFALAWTNAPPCIVETGTNGRDLHATTTTTALTITGSASFASDVVMYHCLGWR